MMRPLGIVLIGICFMLCKTAACLGSNPEGLIGNEHNNPKLSEQLIRLFPFNEGSLEFLLMNKADNTSWLHKDVTVKKAGTLIEILGDEINEIDSISVHGPINDVDFETLWSASFYGCLSVINLEDACIENNSIPNSAFWHQSEQTSSDGSIYTICLSKIILPNQVERLGDMAFAYAINLQYINIPESIVDLGIYSFSDCSSLCITPLEIPLGVTAIPAMCFRNCKALDEIILPSSIRVIKEGAFWQAKIKHINLPVGLERIENCAFYSTELEDVEIPSTCIEFSGSHQFALCHKLKKLTIPNGVTFIPNCFAYNDTNLESIEMPETTSDIGSDAFSTCMKLESIQLPEGLATIESNAFWYCNSLSSLIFPSSLTYLGGASCQYLQSLKEIWCGAPIPPVCNEDPANKGRNHTFGPISGYAGNLCTPSDIPVYIPIGSAEMYRTAYGWNYFSNFIETDSFPAGINDSVFQDSKSCEVYYDLFGRRCTNPVPGHLYIRGDGKKVLYSAPTILDWLPAE